MLLSPTSYAQGRKSGLVGNKLDSRLKGRGFESCPLLDGNDVKVMPGSIPETPNPGSYRNERNTGGQKNILEQ